MILKVTPDTDSRIFYLLSTLDKECTGAEGWSAESFFSEVCKSNGIVLCVMENSQIKALVSGYFAEGEGDITSLAVSRECRRRGLATALIEEFEKNLPENTENIFLEVRESNDSAIRLYRKCGFERLSVRKNFYINPNENAIVMIKKLKER